MRQVRITGTGRALPTVLIPNSVMDERFGAGTAAWVETNVGIEQRFHLAEGAVGSDLAVAAAKQALARAKVTAEQIDLIILSTDTPDQLSPSTAAVVQHQLGATKAGCFDLNAACSGWVIALDTAAMHLKADPAKQHVLVIGLYAMSRFLNWQDKTTATLFADGSGAVVLSAGSQQGHLATTLWSDGSMWDALGVYDGGSRHPAGGDVRPFVRFVKKFPKTYNLEHWPRLLKETSKKAGVPLDGVKHFIFTQLNLRVIEAVMDELALPRERAHYVGNKWGYTGNACIPMALDDAFERGVLQRGDVIALCASGGGVSMATSFLRWDP